MAAIGFLTFGQGASGLVLNNYAPRDALIQASRVAVAASLVFSYPLAFQVRMPLLLRIAARTIIQAYPTYYSPSFDFIRAAETEFLIC
jgi:hypothetical protein